MKIQVTCLFFVLNGFALSTAYAWKIPVDTEMPIVNEDASDSFASSNQGRFGPNQCPDKSQVYSLNMVGDYSGSIRALPGTDADLNLFNKITNLISNVPMSRSVSVDPSYTKSSLLSYLTQFARGKKYVNLNFSGHGETIEGKSYVVLPGYFKCLKGYTQGRLSQVCGQFLVSGQEIESSMKNTHVFGIFATCKSGDIIRDMPKSSMIAGSEPGRDILDNYGQLFKGWDAAELANPFTGSEIAGRINDLIENPISCGESIAKNGQVTFADIPRLLPKRVFFKDRPSGKNVKDSINDCFVLKPASQNCHPSSTQDSRTTRGAPSSR